VSTATYIAIQEVAASSSTGDESSAAWRVAAHDADDQPAGLMNVETDTFADAVKWAKSMRGIRKLPIIEVDAQGKAICVIEPDAGQP
jgi:hypothetical protein